MERGKIMLHQVVVLEADVRQPRHSMEVLVDRRILLVVARQLRAQDRQLLMEVTEALPQPA
jgi:hypothetical protein